MSPGAGPRAPRGTSGEGGAARRTPAAGHPTHTATPRLLPRRRLCSAAFSLSEEELLRARRDVHGSFAQMDRSLALPRIRARVLLQQLHTAWREAEFQKVDQAPAAPELQVRGASWGGVGGP